MKEQIISIEAPEVEEGQETRPANRKERRDYVRGLPRFIRLDYGFGKIHHETPGVFISPARAQS